MIDEKKTKLDFVGVSQEKVNILKSFGYQLNYLSSYITPCVSLDYLENVISAALIAYWCDGISGTS